MTLRQQNETAYYTKSCNPSVGQHFLMQRKQHGGHKIPLTDQQYHDLCVVQMADWLEQVRSAHEPDNACQSQSLHCIYYL